jgi:hypothetical protein
MYDTVDGWVSMTGGAGDGGGGGDDATYLRLDGGNNNPSPNNYLRQSDSDARYLQLTGGTLSGSITFAGDNAYVIGTADFALNTVYTQRLRVNIIREQLSGMNVLNAAPGYRHFYGTAGSVVLRLTDEVAQVGNAPRTGSEVRNVSSGISAGMPSGSQPGDIHLQYDDTVAVTLPA